MYDITFILCLKKSSRLCKHCSNKEKKDKITEYSYQLQTWKKMCYTFKVKIFTNLEGWPVRQRFIYTYN